jgi:hypothetical protein
VKKKGLTEHVTDGGKRRAWRRAFHPHYARGSEKASSSRQAFGCST